MKYLDPRNDVTFKKVFGTHKNLCMSLLNSLLELPDDAVIESIEYQDADVLPPSEYNKNSLVDVKCVDNLGRSFIVEMQLYWYESFMSRTLLNAAKTYVSQSFKGQEYRDLKPVYSLCLLNDVFLKEEQYEKEFIHTYSICNEEHPELKIRGMEFVFVEMPKFRSGNKAHNKMANLWMKYMNYVAEKTSLSEIDPELVNEPIIKEAIDYLEEASYTNSERVWYDKYWDSVSSYKSALSDAVILGEKRGEMRGLELGKEIGKEMGAMQERISIVLNMKSEGCSASMISKFLKLSIDEVEEIISGSDNKGE